MRFKVPPRFVNIEEPWRNCYLCAQFTADQPTSGDDEEIVGGRMHPESDLIEYEGRYYCADHFLFKFNCKLRDENRIDIEEIDPYPEVE